MKQVNNSLLSELKEKITKSFPQVIINTEYFEELDENFISISDQKVYESEEYKELIFNITQNLWDKNVYNIHFSYDYRLDPVFRFFDSLNLLKNTNLDTYENWKANETKSITDSVDINLEKDAFLVA